MSDFPAPWAALLLPPLAECLCSARAGASMQNGGGEVFISLKKKTTKPENPLHGNSSLELSCVSEISLA